MTVTRHEADDPPMTTPMEQADAIERAMIEELEQAIVVKSVIYTSGLRDPRGPVQRPANASGKRYMMGQDPRLPRMPEKPTLVDYFTHRFGPTQHLLQSARLAQKNGASEKMVLACLLHDIATAGFIRGDHGYWSAQLVEPYVDPEVSWAIRYHQALRFYADESVGYRYPDSYRKLFGPDYEPEPYIERDYQHAAKQLTTSHRGAPFLADEARACHLRARLNRARSRGKNACNVSPILSPDSGGLRSHAVMSRHPRCRWRARLGSLRR